MSSDNPDCTGIRVEISTRDVFRQFWRDFYDKEVQSAATYSYLWMADQMGHVALGLLVVYMVSWLFSGLARISQWPLWQNIYGPLAVSIMVLFLWELSTYFSFVKSWTEIFRLDRGLLRWNALTAFFYMALGSVVGFAWEIGGPNIGMAATLIALLVALAVAVPWMRQKIIWQKAGLPFLSRLANSVSHIDQGVPKQLEALLDSVKQASRSGRGTAGRAVILTGPLGAGKTSLACGIGTECAFAQLKVRYTTFDKLAQMATASGDDQGPENIEYWRWKESEVLIIDDIDSGSRLTPYLSYGEFEGILKSEFRDAVKCLGRRTTVWVVGPKSDAELTEWRTRIESTFGQIPEGVLTVRLISSITPALKAAGKPRRLWFLRKPPSQVVRQRDAI